MRGCQHSPTQAAKTTLCATLCKEFHTDHFRLKFSAFYLRKETITMTMTFTLKEGGFGTTDYVAFFILCISSCAGGLWYSAQATKTKKVVDIKDYLLGSRSLSTFPVALSLIASYVSGVTILGTPAEIYNYGSQYWLIVVGVTASCLVVVLVYLPVFHTLNLSSSYETPSEKIAAMDV
ncbi:sodium:solute symporter family domain-containing protein [Phthorimaea operculella]|nr:sodium:solute symporter family domain-containing protein [Phthorimaea operculella]